MVQEGMDQVSFGYFTSRVRTNGNLTPDHTQSRKEPASLSFLFPRTSCRRLQDRSEFMSHLGDRLAPGCDRFHHVRAEGTTFTTIASAISLIPCAISACAALCCLLGDGDESLRFSEILLWRMRIGI
jgi:hypothetical protein